MAIAVWIVSAVLAVGFVVGGIVRATAPAAVLERLQLGWVNELPRWQVRVISTLEILGGLGLILPVLTGILPVLTPLAACGLAIVMAGAFVFQVRRRNWSQVPVTVVFAGLSILVAVARFAGI
jgi:uncharacterized membrane protein